MGSRRHKKEYREKRGSAMLDAWVAEVGAQGCDRTNVYTDSTISRDFYERYGFKRVREAHIKSLFYSLPGIDVQGCI